MLRFQGARVHMHNLRIQTNMQYINNCLFNYETDKYVQDLTEHDDDAASNTCQQVCWVEWQAN